MELELLKVFIDVCEKLNLRYYLCCGSVLGAVKYQGFIPWDDDIDVCLPREDYDIFVKEAPGYLPSNLFLQNYKTDPEFPSVISKIRNSETTWIEEGVAHLNINHGIYLDVFPLDGYPKGQKEQRNFEKKKMHFERIRAVSYKQRFNFKAIRTNLVLFANKLFGAYSSSASNIGRYEAFISSYPTQTSDIWCNHGNWQGSLEYAQKNQYGKGTQATFEGLRVIIPENYDEYLTQKYGDWRRDPTKEKQKTHHCVRIADTKKSYKEYLK
ncbi:MAG: LicD family protein [Clostridia bacterium]|nr:LicD family protein [Clostridia bacterium]